MGIANRYSEEVWARAVRMVQEHQSEHGFHWAMILAISAKTGGIPGAQD